METRSNAIIADTSALVSLVNPTDLNHERAVEEATQLKEADRLIVLPSEVLAETVNILGKKFGHKTASVAAVLMLHDASQFLLVETTAGQLRAALDIFRKQTASVSFTDCIVMTVADEQRTKDIFGFDEQFERAGYNRLAPAAKSAA